MKEIKKESICDFSEIKRSIQDSLTKLNETLVIAQKEITKQFRIKDKINKVAIGFKFDNFFNNLSESTRDALKILAYNGWFVDEWGMSPGDIFTFSDLFKNGKNIDADNMLIDHFRKRLLTIEKEIEKKFKNRDPILGPAFKAHIRGEYVLSIPVFLSQVDGICYEVTKKYFFIKKNGQPEIAEYIKNCSDGLQSAILYRDRPRNCVS